MPPAITKTEIVGRKETRMKRIAVSILMIGVAIALVAGCGRSTGQSGGSSAKASNDKEGEAYAPNIEPSDFVGKIDNKFFPLDPGTTFVYEGETEEGTERIEVTVTNDTKRVAGVECVVVSDKVFLNGGLIEDTFDWYAQDKEGNVWYFGEETKEYENGKVVSTEGSWETGVDGAKPGIIMQADPKVGETYRQEYYPDEAEDMAKVLSLDESATVPYGSFDHLLTTKDWNPLDPAAGIEQKYYAPGIGNVLEVGVKGTSDRVELVDIKKE
jgi:hypothetical protein